MPRPEIRKAEIGDADEIGELIRLLAEKFITREFAPEAAARFLGSNDGSSVRRNIESGFSYHVAVHRGRIVGVVGMKPGSHLYHLFVAEEHQGAGLARKLWQQVSAESMEAGGAGVITVNSSLNAIGFYEKLGFVRSGPTDEKEGIRYNPMEYRVDR